MRIDPKTRDETRLRLVINSIPAMAWSLEADGTLDFVNQRWLDYTGLSFQEAIQDSKSIVHPDDLPAAVEKWLPNMAAGLASEHEIRLRQADGEYRWFLIRIVPLCDERGGILKWYGASTDIDERKRTEKRWRILIDAIPQQIWSAPPNGATDYCNERWRSYAGLELEDVQGYGWQTMLHADDRERVLSAWSQSVDTGVPFEQEERHCGADGTYRWFLARAVALRDAEGRIVRWYGTNTDIEDRKRAEEELNEQALRYKTLMATSPDSICVLDENGDVKEANVAFLDRRGYTEADAKGLNVADFDARWDREELAKKRRDLADTSALFETQHRCKDGSVFDVEVSATSVRIGDEQLVFCVTRDITERKHAEQRLRRSEEKFKTLFDLAPVGISVLDAGLNVIDANPALERILHLTREELLGGSWRHRAYLDAAGTRRRREEMPSVRAITEGQPFNELEMGIVTESGDTIWTQVSAAPLSLPDASAVVITQDITERKRTQQTQARALSLMLATLESTADGILVVNTEGEIVTFNRLFAQMWRLSDEVLASKEDGRALESVLDQLTEPEKFLEKVRYLYEHPEEESFDRLVFKDGRAFERYSRPQLVDGKVAGRVWSFRDVTERKRVRAALRESEERFRLLAEVTNDAVWDWDLVTNELWWNEGFETLFGYNRGEIEKTIDGWYDRIHPTERSRVVSGIHRVISDGEKTWSAEYRFLCKDGTYAYVLDRGEVIRNADGKGVRMVGGMRDLTERNLAEAAAQALPGELLRAQDEERRRIARELHDSTAQELAVVSMNLGRLEEWMEGKDPWAENLLADSLAVLTQGNRDLRTLAHLLHPPMLEELGLIGALRDYVGGFSARSGIEVELESKEDFERCSPEIETALFRVVQESLSNVHRHSTSKVAMIKLIRNGDLIELTIIDRGKGLPRGLLLGTAETARVGVGISGMRQRIIQLQGHLEISSNEDGTTVCAVLPCCLRGGCTSEPSA
jgi:PAS domain S-box-containing protein